MARLKTFLARISCVVFIATCTYRGILEQPVHWPTRLLSLFFVGLGLLYLLLDVWGSQMRKIFPILSRLDSKSVHIRVNDERTDVYSADGQRVFSVANRLVWRSGKKGRRMVAVGTAEEWPPSVSQDCLEDAIYTDLVAEATPETPHIEELWPAFIHYCEREGNQKAGIGFWRQVYHSKVSPLRIEVRLSDPFKRAFVGDLIEKGGSMGLLDVIITNEDESVER